MMAVTSSLNGNDWLRVLVVPVIWILPVLSRTMLGSHSNNGRFPLVTSTGLPQRPYKNLLNLFMSAYALSVLTLPKATLTVNFHSCCEVRCFS
ncbi:hypothetical protein ID866_3924 [Astraeus odoratus]|nr:hypothetical protein ID866_3924 [Astraeus odoratus]